MEIIANIFKALGEISTSGTVACWHWFLDEPEMPKSMIEKM